jgi:thiamine biosynthesis lipoprotein
MTGVHEVLHLMGMVISFDVRDADADPECVTAAVDWLHLVNNTFSTFKADSEISRIDRGEMAVSDSHPDVQYVLDQCAAIAADSDGCFSAWRESDGIAHLDPAGYVKGWAVEQAAEIIESYGVKNFSINAGGDIAIRGNKAPGEPWAIGIRHPDNVSQIVAVLDITGPYAVATSGT